MVEIQMEMVEMVEVIQMEMVEMVEVIQMEMVEMVEIQMRTVKKRAMEKA